MSLRSIGITQRLALRASVRTNAVSTIRPFSQSTQSLMRKDSQGKDDLKPEPNEYSKSGSDDDSARISDTAFSPDKTSPEEQHDAAEGESKAVSSYIPNSSRPPF